MSKRKIINDPVYGLISFPFDEIYELIDHPYFQRLRRISQMGMSSYVYPGATHTRFNHALGALHLTTLAINTLKEKGLVISDSDYLSLCQAILLHDIGHGPYSHGLEHLIMPLHHERIGLDIMRNLQKQGFDLENAINIYTGAHPKKYLKQLVSSQLDMDRMDYLTRDSFFSGVIEGSIGYKRLIAMMDVVNEELVMEEKAMVSIEKFLLARHFMYRQVYQHKTSVIAERMLQEFIKRLAEFSNEIASEGSKLADFIAKSQSGTINENNYLETFLQIDDTDVISCMKICQNHKDFILSYLSTSLLRRRLFKVIVDERPLSSDLINNIRQKVVKILPEQTVESELPIYEGEASVEAYDKGDVEIKIVNKNRDILTFADLNSTVSNVKKITHYYLCYPDIFE